MGYGDDSGEEERQGYRLLRESDHAIIYSCDVVFKPEIPMEPLLDKSGVIEEEWIDKSGVIEKELDRAIERGHIVTKRGTSICSEYEPLSDEELGSSENYLTDEETSEENHQGDDSEAHESLDDSEAQESLVLLSRLTALPIKHLKSFGFKQCTMDTCIYAKMD